MCAVRTHSGLPPNAGSLRRLVFASGSGGGGGASSTIDRAHARDVDGGLDLDALEHAVVAVRPCVTLPTTRPGREARAEAGGHDLVADL